MKLAAAALAALSLSMVVGCATDNDGEGGAHLLGLRPAKPSLDDTKPPVPGVNNALNHYFNGGLYMDIRGVNDGDTEETISAESISVPFPIEGLCEICDDGVIALRNPRDPSELSIIDDVGNLFCKIWVDSDGHIETTDCR